MRIKNNPKIFYLACGLLAEGDMRYDKNDVEVAALADKIQRASREASLDAEILQWFNLAKTGQIEPNPYWPRGQAMMMAIFFTDDSNKLDIDQLMTFLESTDIKDPIGDDEFREWIGRLPEVLAYTESIFRVFWKEYCKIIFVRTGNWMPEIEASRKPLKEFFGKNPPNLVLAPNLFADPFSADFVRCDDDAVILIACKPDIERMLQEALRGVIAKYDEKFAAVCEDGDEGEEHSKALATQECFIRALSTILAGGDQGRIQSHVNSGFTSVPAIAKCYEKHRPKADSLGDFIDIVFERSG